MTETDADMPLPRSRPPADDVQAERITLELSDGYTTEAYHYAPPAGASGLPVVYLHGIQSHPGWFTGSCEHIARGGREVLAVSRRGSGSNTEARGHAPSADVLLDDVYRAVDFAGGKAGAERVHLLGVSWGGKLAAAAAADPDRRGRLASLVLVAPGIVPLVDVSFGVKLGVALSLLIRPRRLFEIPLGDVELFTDNEQMRRYIREDHMSLRRATARFLFASRKLDGRLRRMSEGSVTAETTLVLSDRDRIVNNDKTRQVVERLTDGRATVAELPGAHTLEFEQDPSALYAAIDSALARGEQ